MSEAMEWKGDRLLLTLGRDPEAILVRLFPAKLAPCRGYVPQVEALRLQRENAKLRELIWDMWATGMCECDYSDDCRDCVWKFPDRMRELGVVK